jgi:HSP20 family molecular chaperone IbpA
MKTEKRKSKGAPRMSEKSVPTTAVQTAASQPPVTEGRTETISERIERMYDAVAQRAFELFERDGRADGHALRHWLEAEKNFLHPVHIGIKESKDEFAVRAEVPGFTANDLEVNIDSRRLTISGKRNSTEEHKEGDTIYSEQCSSEIFRTIDLPSEVDATRVSATIKDGVLSIQIPKAEEKKNVASKTNAA